MLDAGKTIGVFPNFSARPCIVVLLLTHGATGRSTCLLVIHSVSKMIDS